LGITHFDPDPAGFFEPGTVDLSVARMNIFHGFGKVKKFREISGIMI
jgi:hypothetical protein